ncbi:hypothetical protein B5807_00788 [Epicoccum nigrum]|uniref:chitinase n=1 Tax=Epicoccum nigrum TaxID=105696 RepID=A0A1Y2MCW6_EPING|nr:hypothetical protein B5807_00788 [Epicoccum nigrum]
MTVSKDDATIQQFAKNVSTMVTNNDADGVDIDWEYPGGNGADYKQTTNDVKKYQIEAYPKVLEAIRTAIGHDKLLSIAVPGKKEDMMAFTSETGPKIWPQVDFINVMSYDLVNRRDTMTGHHTSVVGSEDTIKNYLAIGAPPEKLNLGFAYYAKYFTTENSCSPTSPLKCALVPGEDAAGQDTMKGGTWTFEKANMEVFDIKTLPESKDGSCGPEHGTKCPKGNCCSQYGSCGNSMEFCSGACWHAWGEGCTGKDIAGSWQQAAAHGVADNHAGGQYYFDDTNKLFWTWDTPELITRKFKDVFAKYKLGGVMAWSLGLDGYDYSHVHRMAEELLKHPSQPDGTSAASSMAPAP